MGINNSGLTIRSGNKNADSGKLDTQALLPTKISKQIANASPGDTITASILSSTTNIIVDKELIENAKKTPASPFSLSGNIPASTLNPVVKTTKKQKTEKQKIIEKLYFKPDVLNLPSNTYTNNKFKNSSLKGIASQRPEIIALTDFKPIFENQKILKYNNLGYFFDYKFQLLKLREKTIENIKKIFSTNLTVKTEYDKITKNFQDFIKIEEEKLKLIESFVKIFQSVDKAFQIREIDNSFFKTNNLLTIEEFFVQKMNYSKTSYNSFSDTKILYQLLFDLRAASENYSINLLNLTDTDRINDVNSVKIDTTYSKTNNFTFDVNTLSTKINGGAPKLSLNENNFFSFLNSLPGNLSDRIKVCLHIFGRVLRISKGLNKPNVKSMIANNFSISTDFNPFDNILGIIPADIFTQPFGNGTIASTFLLSDSTNPNIKILPFENTIVDDGETKYVPGNVYFKDDIIETTETVSLINYGENLVSKISNTSFLYNEIFDFGNLNFNLIPQNIIKIIFETIKNTLSYCTDTTTVAAESLIIPALLNLSNTDKVLKFYLFQFVLLLGLIKATKESNFELYRKLKTEIKTLKNFPNVELDLVLTNDTDQSSSIKNAAISLANTISLYVSKVLTENSILQLNTDASFSPPPRNDGFSSLFLQTNALISKTLLDTVNATTSNKPNLFKDFLDISSIFYNAATPFLNEGSEQLTTSTYLNISLSNIMLLLFETVASISGKFLPIKFDLENGKIFGILYHARYLKASQRAIEKLLTGLPKNLYSFQTEISIPFNQGAQSTNQEYILPISTPFLYSDEDYIRKFDYFYTEYKDIYDSLQGEDSFLKNILSIFETISFNFNQVKRFTENTFARLTEEQKQIVTENSGIISQAQFVIAKKLLTKLKQENTLTNLLKDNEFYHLSSFIINQNISTDKMKILSVGIPNGFIDNVKERLNKISAINGQEQIVDFKNETSLISVNVYKKSLLDEEIIFKPQKFIFDLLLDVSTYDKAMPLDPTDTFENNSKFLKFIQNDDSSLTPKSKQEILLNERYGNLSIKNKEEVVLNTIKSYLLSKYCYLSTGFEISEETFPLTEYNFSPSEEFNVFLRLYLLSKNIQINSFEELLKNDTIDQNIKDDVTLIKKVFNEFNNQTTDSIIFTPKSFDRIFNIVLNTKTFEIDTELTNSRTLENEQIKERLYKKDDKLYINSFNNTDMDEFYIAVEILG